MKLIFLLLAVIFSHTLAAQSDKEPSGEQVFIALLGNSNLNLNGEPLCKQNSKLYQLLASALSLSFDEKNVTTVKSYCSKSKSEIGQGKVVDAWDCSLEIVEKNTKGEFNAGSLFKFDLTFDRKRFIKGSLRCL